MTWMQTLNGHAVDLLQPDLTLVSIEEVAHALSLINRFTGHTLFPAVGYSVAQHSVAVAYHLPPEYAFAGLMHDAHEAFLGDISSPVKAALRRAGTRILDVIETQLMGAVQERWPRVVVPGDDDAVKVADEEALGTERRDLMGPSDRDWGPMRSPWPEKLMPLKPHEAASLFLRTFRNLEGQRW